MKYHVTLVYAGTDRHLGADYDERPVGVAKRKDESRLMAAKALAAKPEADSAAIRTYSKDGGQTCLFFTRRSANILLGKRKRRTARVPSGLLISNRPSGLRQILASSKLAR